MINAEADAGLVYLTDAQSAGETVEVIAIEGVETDPNRYPVAVLERSESSEQAAEFIEFVLMDERARLVLDDAGFAGAEDS